MLQSPTHFKPRDMTFSLVHMLLLSSLTGKVIYANIMRQVSVENAKPPRKTETELLPPHMLRIINTLQSLEVESCV